MTEFWLAVALCTSVFLNFALYLYIRYLLAFKKEIEKEIEAKVTGYLEA